MRKVSILVMLLAIICLGVGCSANKNAPLNVTTNISSSQKHPVFIMAGRIEAGEKAAISSRITARVDSVSVEPGSKVEKGAPLIQLDSGDLAAQAAQARAGVEQSQASLDSAQVSQINAKGSFDRYQELFNAGAVSKAQLEQAQAELATADSALNAARAKLNQSQAALDLAAHQLDNGTIISPISGVVSAKNINNGELAVSGVQLLNIVNSESLIINAYMPAYLSNQIAPGQEVVIKVTEIPGKIFTGQIEAVDSVVDSKNSNLLVKVQFTNRDPALKPGMFAQIGINNREALQ